LGGSGGKTPDEIVMQMADEFEAQLPELLSRATGNQEHFVTNEEGNMHSLSIVLLQEIEKFNILLSTLKRTLA
jgi:dynein heavy chain